MKVIPNPLSKFRFQITAIVPVYNNQQTIASVVSTLLKINDIKEVLVINDGSRDLTSRKLSKFIDHKKCNVITTAKNKGKGWAIAMGINEARGNVILMCDADLKNLQNDHIYQMIQILKKNNTQMVIASRAPMTGFVSRFFARLSGERIFYKNNLSKKHLRLMKKSGYGVEKIINHAHKNKKIDFVISQDINHQLKYQRCGFAQFSREYFWEAQNVFFTDLRLRFVNND